VNTLLPNAYVGFDLETTGRDPESARIVTAAVVEVLHGSVVASRTWLVNPGVEIPAEATSVHGITTERAWADGMDASRATAEIAGMICQAFSAGVPLVIMNAPYDLTLLDRECRRYGVTTVTDMLEVAPHAVVLDPLVLDRHVDPYRPGKRTLQALAEYYDVTLTDAHEASADAEAAVRVTNAILSREADEDDIRRTTRHNQVHRRELAELHLMQKLWHAAWAAGFQDWLRRTKRNNAVVPSDWPVTEYRLEHSHAA
jgi:DNA polymerase-3 subunit epsilon